MMMMRPWRPLRRSGWIALVLATSACGSTGGGPNPFDGDSIPTATQAEEPIRVEVNNVNFNDATIWALRSGQRIRLGRVTGKTDQEFRIAWNVAIPISFQVDIVGGRECRTGNVGVERNARVWLTIPSRVGVQPCQAGRR